MHVRFETLENVRRDLRRSHRAVGVFVDTGDLPGGGRDAFTLAVDGALVADRPSGDFGDRHGDLELLLEPQRPVVFARGRHARPADRRLAVVNDQPPFTPQGVLRVSEVAEVIRKMDDAGQVRLRKLNPPTESERPWQSLLPSTF